MEQNEKKTASTLAFHHPDFEFDDIAENIFLPIYEVIATDLLEETGVVSGQMLDIGCGGGHLGLAVMAQSKLRCTFMDINRTAVSCAEERAAKRGLESRAEFICASVEQMPFTDGHFQLIVSRGSMPFWNDQEKAVSEICRVLAPGGKGCIGGSLGRPDQREVIMKKMKHYGLACMGGHPERSRALPDEEYIRLGHKYGCECSVIDDDDRGHWLVFSK